MGIIGKIKKKKRIPGKNHRYTVNLKAQCTQA